MRVCIFSTAKFTLSNKGDIINKYKAWERGGEEIKYFYSEYNDKLKKQEISLSFLYSRNLYCLSFNYNFEYENDLVFFALSEPFLFSDLNIMLSEYKSNTKCTNKQIQAFLNNQFYVKV